MRAGELREVVSVFTRSDVGTDGYQSARYTRKPSGGSWPAKKILRSAIETTVGRQAQHTVRATWVFRIHAETALTSDGLIRHVRGSVTEWWSITGIRRHYDDDRFDRGGVSVDAVLASDEPAPEDLVE